MLGGFRNERLVLALELINLLQASKFQAETYKYDV